MKHMGKLFQVSEALLKKVEKDLVEKAKLNARSGADELQKSGAIKSHVIRGTNGTVRIEVWADTNKDVAPMARAQEFGSGIHRPSGKPKSPNEGADQKILIKPVTQPYLAFVWEKYNTQEGLPEGTVSRFKFVRHPGVKALNNGEGYMRPAGRDAADDPEFRTALGVEMVESVRKTVKATFRKSLGKRWQEKR